MFSVAEMLVICHPCCVGPAKCHRCLVGNKHWPNVLDVLSSQTLAKCHRCFVWQKMLAQGHRRCVVQSVIDVWRVINIGQMLSCFEWPNLSQMSSQFWLAEMLAICHRCCVSQSVTDVWGVTNIGQISSMFWVAKGWQNAIAVLGGPNVGQESSMFWVAQILARCHRCSQWL